MSLPPSCTDFMDFSSQALQLFHDYQWVYSFKAIELLFLENCNRIPLEIKSHFQGIQNTENFRSILNLQTDDCQPTALTLFIESCKRISALTLTQDYSENENLRPENEHQVESKIRWPKKKIAEVLHLSEFVRSTCQENNCDLIIDVGSGLGYLSCHLAENTGLDVLAIDSECSKLLASQRKATPTRGNVFGINLELNSDAATQIEPYTEQFTDICITGLHACGDLTPSSIKLFLEESKYQALAIVPCCYHKMNFGVNSNFPMSQKLKQVLRNYPNPSFLQNLQLCRLASQRSGENFLNDISAETKQVFYRSLLELYVHKENLSLVKNKRRGVRGGLTTFDDYVNDAIGPNSGYSIEGSFEQNRNKLQSLYRENLPWMNPIIGILAMQGALQPIAENLILLDRLEYLLESGKVDEAQVIRVIPKSVTPRGRVIFATKKKNTNSDSA